MTHGTYYFQFKLLNRNQVKAMKNQSCELQSNLDKMKSEENHLSNKIHHIASGTCFILFFFFLKKKVLTTYCLVISEMIIILI